VLAVGERLLANVLLRAEQGADALLARGGHRLDPRGLGPRGGQALVLNGGAVIALLMLLLLRWKVGDL
jgi:energy-coupling factor transport system permease protein